MMERMKAAAEVRRPSGINPSGLRPPRVPFRLAERRFYRVARHEFRQWPELALRSFVEVRAASQCAWRAPTCRRSAPSLEAALAWQNLCPHRPDGLGTQSFAPPSVLRFWLCREESASGILRGGRGKTHSRDALLPGHTGPYRAEVREVQGVDLLVSNSLRGLNENQPQRTFSFTGADLERAQTAAGSRWGATRITNSPRFTSTSIRCPARNSPCNSLRARGFWIRRWIVRLSGRAPKCGS
jgi:hypothetical protein